MKHLLSLCVLAGLTSEAWCEQISRDIPYADAADSRQVLDIYAADGAKDQPVIFWIHGGGWQTGDKAEVDLKPRFFMNQGFVFVSTNYRLLPDVEMEIIISDVAQAAGWVHQHIAEYGGDPNRILIAGHSAGAQLAALLCTDERYLKQAGVSLACVRGCIPVDGDTYDIPAIIETAETRCRAHGFPLPTFGHRQKFGNDPEKHIHFSAVTHIARDRQIPPFLIVHVADHPDCSAQARRLESELLSAEIPVTRFGGRETTHGRINSELGEAGDPTTEAVIAFLNGVRQTSP